MTKPWTLPMTVKIAALSLVALLAAGAASAQGRGAPLGPPGTNTAFPDLTTGETLYKGVCQGCHMPDAKGAVGAGMYPALASNDRLGTAAYPIVVLLNGQKAMPEFGDMLTDVQIANVVGYIRTGFGNKYKDKVTRAEVAELRKAP